MINKVTERHLQSLMKTLLLTSTLTLSLMFSAGSWAEWTLVAEEVDGSSKNYVDVERIRKVDGLVYYWSLTDYLEPGPQLVMSFKSYWKVDCETMRGMPLSNSAYKLPMAEGTDIDSWTPDPEWQYAPPGSVAEVTLLAVCAH